MNSQYRKNLKDLATACKNYVDETKEQILWQVGQYDISTQDDNTTAYQKIVPTGATRCKLKSIGGMSYKSNNLANNPTITSNATNDFQIFILLDNLNLPAGTYTLSFKNVNTLNSGTRYYMEAVPNMNYAYTGAVSTKTDYSITFTTTAVITTRLTVRLQYTSGGDTGTTTNVMLNSGSTALPYEPYFENIRDNAVTSVKSYDSNNNLIDTLTIPSEVQALSGYGWGVNSTCYNCIDFENKKFIKNTAKYTFTGNETLTEYTRLNDNTKTYAFLIAGRATTLNVLFTPFNKTTATTMNNMENNTYRGATDTTAVIFYSTNYQTAADMLTFLTGKTIYFEIPAVETDISQYIPNNVIEVEEGGYLVFENPYGQAVPSNITYRIEVAK